MPIPIIAWGITAVAGYVAKKVCDTVVESKKVSSSSNPPTQTQAQQQAILKPITDRLDNLDKDITDKIKEQLGDKQMTPREKKEVLEKVKGMSKEERTDLLNQLKNENSAEQEAINKTLKEKLEKQEKRSIQLAKELKEAKESNDPAQVVKVAQMIKDNDKNQQTTRLALKKSEEEAKKQAKMIEQYFQSVEKGNPWYMDMNFKSPWLWGILLFTCVVFYLLFKGFMWSWNKIKSTIWGDN